MKRVGNMKYCVIIKEYNGCVFLSGVRGYGDKWQKARKRGV